MGDGRDSSEPDAKPTARLAPRVPLPPYRYLPGRTPHPLRSRIGHLRTRRPEDAPADDDEAVRYGVDLFAAGYFWEAHEAWEGAWHFARDERRVVLQSLIQLAAGHLKRELGAPRAARQLYLAAAERLSETSSSVVDSISVAKLRAALARAIDEFDRPLSTPDSLVE